MVWWVNFYLDPLSDEDFKRKYCKGKNHGIWLLGHLIAAEDDFATYMGKGDFLFPEYQKIFANKSKVLSLEKYPLAAQLRKEWKSVCERNEKIYQNLQDIELDEAHALLKGKIEDDWFKTKEGIIVNWIAHQLHHSGHLALLKARKKQ